MDSRAIEFKEKLKEDRFAVRFGIVIDELDEEHALCSLEMKAELLNAFGVGHGGTIFSLADYAFGVHANYLFDKTVTQSGTITYLAPATNTKRLYAKSRFIARERHNCFFMVEICDDSGKIISVATFDGFTK